MPVLDHRRLFGACILDWEFESLQNQGAIPGKLPPLSHYLESIINITSPNLLAFGEIHGQNDPNNGRFG